MEVGIAGFCWAKVFSFGEVCSWVNNPAPKKASLGVMCKNKICIYYASQEVYLFFSFHVLKMMEEANF